jgi:hypothetical protein
MPLLSVEYEQPPVSSRGQDVDHLTGVQRAGGFLCPVRGCDFSGEDGQQEGRLAPTVPSEPFFAFGLSA